MTFQGAGQVAVQTVVKPAHVFGGEHAVADGKRPDVLNVCSLGRANGYRLSHFGALVHLRIGSRPSLEDERERFPSVRRRQARPTATVTLTALSTIRGFP